MIFTGREKEKKKIIKELERGNNVILTGKFGIGRTSLIKKISKQLDGQRQIVFVDFSQTPRKISERLMKELQICNRFKRTGNKMGYKSMRYRIAETGSLTKNKPVIVFDNIAKLTQPKITFLKYLHDEGHFQFIAIIENFLSEKHVLLLKILLFPATNCSLGYLSDSDVSVFIRHYAKMHHLELSDAYIASLTLLAGGYPLGMISLAKKLSSTIINTVSSK
ncbi:MAG: AAA family ATPase [Smithellaceae bacterium]